MSGRRVKRELITMTTTNTHFRLTFISNMHKHAAVGSTCRSKGVTPHEDPTSMEEKKRTEERRREELQV